MTEISQLSPALSLALLNFARNYDVSVFNYREMLKATLFELLLAKVLVATSEKDEGDKYTEISRGPAFNSYQYKPHQLVFKNCLSDKPISMRKYIRQVNKKAVKSFHDAIKGQLLNLGINRIRY